MNIPSITLQSAVMLAVKEFGTQTKPFSIWDLTQYIRTKCNQGELEIPEVECVGGGSHRFQVDHTKVKALFLELRDTGAFDLDFFLSEQFNRGGGYRMYEPVALNSPISPAPVALAVPPAPIVHFSAPQPSSSPNVAPDLSNRISKYLDNCKNRNFRPSLRHVQSAIKRGDHSTGLSVESIRDFITSLGFSLSSDPNALSRYQVVV